MEDGVVKILGYSYAWLLPYVVHVVLAILIFIFGLLAAKLIRNVLNRILRKRKVDETVVVFSVRAAYSLVILFVILATLAELGVQTASLVAVFGAMALAIGLSLRSSLSNLAAGILLVIFRPVRIGDFIEMDGKSGVVTEIQLLFTQVTTSTNQCIIFPNSKFMSSYVINYSRCQTRRNDIVIGIDYADDISKAKALLNEIVTSDDRVLLQPIAPLIAVNDLGSDSVNILLRYWTAKSDLQAVKFSLTEQIKIRFDAENISFPFTQMDVHLYQKDDA